MSNSKDINKKPDSICAVIPFYNEKDTLKLVLDETLKYVNFIIAVNDGSTDDSYVDERKKSQVVIIDLDKNYGKGKALSIGFEKAISRDFDYIITLDADLQHDPKYIPNFIEALSSFDIMIGNRLSDLNGMPLPRIISNKLTSFFLSQKTGLKIIDSQCGFRAYKLKVLQIVKTKNFGFEAESEMLIKAAKKSFSIGFTEIPTVYGNEMSKMRPIEAIIGFIKVLLSSSDN